MFRAMSTRKIHGGYEKLVEEEPILNSVDGNSRDPVQEMKKTPTEKRKGGSVHPLLSLFNVRFQRKKKKSLATEKPTGGSVHPLLSLFNVRFQRKKKKTTKKKSLDTAKPEFARYMEYVKEGGVWDPNSNTPVIHYR
ncbi:uncharacterized protein LOC108853368 [Raphanus sativus]|uniref:Uncharacterized protein LOC108853368 n=1 Tax=Raphanus sativus TaxID=3726 RepID=A0A6J0NC26_RAPSA|nr:uncharacterized protein LOC108853368 [Raphanus sativus]